MSAPQPTEGGPLTDALDTLRAWQDRSHRGSVTLDPEEISNLADLLAARSQRPEQGWTVGGRPVAVLDGRLVEPDHKTCVHHVGLSPGLWCGGCRDALAASQRPEGVTVTEYQWFSGGRWTPFTPGSVGPAMRGNPRYRSRSVTTFPDVVTEWAEVSGDTEAGGDA